MEISFYAAFASARQLRRACNVADEAGGVRSLRCFSKLTIQEAVEKGAYARRRTVWGRQRFRQRGMPVGKSPFNWFHPPVMMWSFREWRVRGEEVGLVIRPLQEPLYYKKMHDKMWAIGHNKPLCTVNVCRKRAIYFGAMTKGKDRRADICRDCSRNLAARGRVTEEAPVRELPAA